MAGGDQQFMDWCALDHQYFRKVSIYSRMKWSNLLADGKADMVACSFAGPIAVWQTSKDANKRLILLTNGYGQVTGKVQWSNPSNLLHTFWTSTQQLVLVQANGRATIYDLFGANQNTASFAMGEECHETGVVDCRSFESTNGTGLAVLTRLCRVFVTNSVHNTRLWRTAELPRKAVMPSCWTVCCVDRVVQVIYIINTDIYVLTQGQQQLMTPSMRSSPSQFVQVAVSPNCTQIALLSDTQRLHLLSIDFKTCLGEFQVDSAGPLYWCGQQAICVHDQSEQTLHLYNEQGTHLPFTQSQPVYVLQECDALRLYSTNTHSLLCPVPEAVSRVCQLASNAPGAMLLLASEKYKTASHTTYFYLRHELKEQLSLAVQQCTDAAAHQWNMQSQKHILAAASFGKSFASDMDSDSLVSTCRLLRVLNALRHSHTAMPLSFTQLQQLSVASLIDRLIEHGQWPLAVSVSRHLRLHADDGVSRVLAHWACAQLREQASAREQHQAVPSARAVADCICSKFNEFPGVSYADVAEKAFEFKLRELATLLVDNEPVLSRQVHMLIKLNQPQTALTTATDSGNPDLVYFVILHLRKHLDKAQLDLLLRGFPRAFALYKHMCLAQSLAHVRALYNQEDHYAGQIVCVIQQAAQTDAFDISGKEQLVLSAERLAHDCADDVLANQFTEQARLMRRQTQLEETFGQSFSDQPLRHTFMWLVQHAHTEQADALRKDFKINDKLHHWWRVEALAMSQQWPQLEAFSKAKKSPIGYLNYIISVLQPFVRMCAKYASNMTEAQKYVGKVSDPEEKVLALLETREYLLAAQNAVHQNNQQLFNRVQAQCPNKQLQEQISALRTQFTTK